MLRNEINDLVDNSFVEHMSRKYKIRVHMKSDDPNRFTKWVDFDYYPFKSPWAILTFAGKYECVILEWLVNVYTKEARWTRIS